jgi:hypothetical protein
MDRRRDPVHFPLDEMRFNLWPVLAGEFDEFARTFTPDRDA